MSTIRWITVPPVSIGFLGLGVLGCLFSRGGRGISFSEGCSAFTHNDRRLIKSHFVGGSAGFIGEFRWYGAMGILTRQSYRRFGVANTAS